MLITRETDYALRILRALADGERRTAGELALGEQVPQQFAYKILKKLHRAGLVEIVRGTAGGCLLAADLKEVSLYDLMEAMEEERLVTACMDPDYRCAWCAAHGETCQAHLGLAELQRTLDWELKSYTLHKIFFGG